MALSSERVREFEQRAHREYHKMLAEIVAEASNRFAQHLETAGAWRPRWRELEDNFQLLEQDRVASGGRVRAS